MRLIFVVSHLDGLLVVQDKQLSPLMNQVQSCSATALCQDNLLQRGRPANHSGRKSRWYPIGCDAPLLSLAHRRDWDCLGQISNLYLQQDTLKLVIPKNP